MEHKAGYIMVKKGDEKNVQNDAENWTYPVFSVQTTVKSFDKNPFSSYKLATVRG